MKFSHSHRLLVLLFASLLSSGLPGCSSLKNDVTTSTGQDISADTFAKIGPGQSKEFVTGLLGQPSERVRQDNGNELWKWYYFQKHRTGDVFFLTPVTEETKTEAVHTVEFKDGVVVNSTGP